MLVLYAAMVITISMNGRGRVPILGKEMSKLVKCVDSLRSAGCGW